MEHIVKLIRKISSKHFMVSILNILGISIIIYILYATQAVWIGWVNVLFNIIKPLFIGLVIAYVLSPLVSFFEKHHFKRSFAIGLVFIIFITFILTLIGTLLPLFYKNITELTNTFTMGIMELEKIISIFIGIIVVVLYFDQYLC